MRHGSLFSGIGGFDLASEWMGWENIFHCEWNPFGQKVLNYYWPKAITYNDITKTDFTIHRGTIDILTGGFPCQPYSSAGKRLGKEDSRHLWPEMLRTIREIQPTWVVGENVRGLTNWNGGLVFDEVQADLEAQGYEVTPFLLPACAVNAPHRRDRIWFIAYNAAYSDLFRFNESIKCNEIYTSEGGVNAFCDLDKGDVNWYASNSQSARTGKNFRGIWGLSNGYCERLQYATDSDSTNSKTRTQREVLGQSDREKTNGYSNVERRNKWENFPTVSPICTRDDGISERLDSITFSKWRNESIKAGGNAIVPQVVHQIFKAIEQYKELDKQLTI